MSAPIGRPQLPGGAASQLSRYRSAAHFVEVFREYYGPVHKAFAALSAEDAQALERDLTALLDGLNRAGAGSLVVPGEYLEVVITRR